MNENFETNFESSGPNRNRKQTADWGRNESSEGSAQGNARQQKTPWPERRAGEQGSNGWALLAAGIAGGGALGMYAFTKRAKTSAAIAAAGLVVLAKGMQSGSSRSYGAKATFAINCTPERAYQFWRDLENLPRFMQYLHSVRVTGEGRSEWTAIGPMNTKLHWTAETTEDRPNERISWRSIPGADVDTAGTVEFRSRPNGRGTMVTANMLYIPPAGALGKTFATIMGKDPEFMVREDLRRFKALIEAGEIATTVGQSHGPRGVHGRAMEVLLREPQNVSAPQASAEMRPAV